MDENYEKEKMLDAPTHAYGDDRDKLEKLQSTVKQSIDEGVMDKLDDDFIEDDID